MRIIYGDICDAACDAIVNASNGIGFMGGALGIRKKLSGVAESIHFVTQGQVEKDAKAICKKHSLIGLRPGSVFVTRAYNLNCHYVIHAVTMRYPGTLASMKAVRQLLPLVLEQARELNLKSIALPLLGTGTGGLSNKKVLDLYTDFFANVDDIDVCVCLYKK